jgi:hypothetical protein
LKTFALCAGLLFAVTANAGFTPRATLVGQRVIASASGGSLLICEYAGARAKFEILAQRGSCARYLDVQ